MTDLVHRFQIGDLVCVAIGDNAGKGSVRQNYPNVVEKDLEAACAALGYTVDAVPGGCTPLAIQCGDQWILIDAGVWQGDDDESGKCLRNLRAAGIAPEAIGMILITHGHFDHFLGLINSDGALIYPNARYFILQTEWQCWTSADVSSFLEGEAIAAQFRNTLLPLKDKFTFLEADAEIMPGVRVVALPGHTPGQCGVSVESKGERLLCLADSLHTPMQLRHPEWHFAYDTHPEIAVATRRHWFDRAAKEKLLTMVCHFPFPALGHIVPDGAAWKWQPIAEQ